MPQNDLSLQKPLTETPSTANILTEEEQIFVVKCLAEFKSTLAIQSLLNERYGKALSEKGVNYYRDAPRWSLLLDKFRDDHLSRIGHVPLANKRVRLDTLQSWYNRIEQGPLTEEEEKQWKVTREILNDCKGEMDSKQTENQLNLVLAQFNNYTSDQLEQKKKELEGRFFKIQEEKKQLVNKKESQDASTE